MSRTQSSGSVAMLVLLTSCGASQHSSTPMATSPEAILGPSPAEAHQEIETLMQSINSELAANEQPALEVGSAPTSTMSSDDFERQCEGPATSTGTCGDICVLSSSVCSNASRICELAAELSGDDWAAQRCDAASVSCTTARSRCCSCSGGAPLMP